MGKLMRTGEDGIQLGSEFDTLFDVYLGPLKSRNTRNIFKAFVEKGMAGRLTTLDIQARLEEDGVELGKKEINGWLHTLEDAGLVSKDAERGKPTTVEYDDRYTFDMWRLTDLGSRIADGLSNLMKREPLLYEEDVMNTLEELVGAEAAVRRRALRRLEELSTLVKTLLILLESGGELHTTSLKRRLMPEGDEVDRLLSDYTKPRRGLALLTRGSSPRGLKARFLGILGLSPKTDAVYALTDEGRRLAEILRRGEDAGK